MLLIYCWGDLGNLIKKTKHDKFKNMYSLEKDGKKFTLVTFYSKQVYEDQLKLKGESETKEKD